MPLSNQWIAHYLTNGLHTDTPVDIAKARRLIRDAAPYQLIASQLYKQGKDGVMRRCIREDEFIPILDEAHSGIVGGYFQRKPQHVRYFKQVFGGLPYSMM